MRRYPQLPSPVSAGIVRQVRRLPVADARQACSTEHPDQYFAPTGGARVAPAYLETVSAALRERATRVGYPDPQGAARRNSFDYECSKYLHESLDIEPGEASRAGVWEFICCVLAPDLVRWRFPGKQQAGTGEERFLGGIRNTFYRLWWRAYLLHRQDASEPYGLVESLNEDEIVQVIERPSLAGSRRLSIAVCEEFLTRLDAGDFSGNRMYLMREVQKRVLRMSGIVDFEVLEDSELVQAVADVFARTIDAGKSSDSR